MQTPECTSDEERGQELGRLEEERIATLNNLEELEQKIKDLNDQMDESSREVLTDGVSCFFSRFDFKCSAY